MIEKAKQMLFVSKDLLMSFIFFLQESWNDGALGKTLVILTVVMAMFCIVLLYFLGKMLVNAAQEYFNYRGTPTIMIDGRVIKRYKEYIPPTMTPLITTVGSVSITNVISSGGYYDYQMLVQADGTQLWCSIDDGDYENAKRDQPVRLGLQTGHDGAKRIKTYQIM